MSEETKELVKISLEILRKTCIENGVSMAVVKETGEICFFDTKTYIEDNKMSGFKIPLESLVK